jgi:hypothetical protein
LIGKASDWIARHRAEMGLSLRITAAGLLAFAAGQLIGLAQAYWAMLTAIIVMQASVGGSLKPTTEPPPLEPVAEALGDYGAVVAGLRRDRLIVPAEDAERIFGLAFALQQVRRNLEELAARAREMATLTASASAPAGG